jgi:hypothetical protein
VLTLCLSPAVRRLQQGKDARLKGGVAVSVLDQQKRRFRALVADGRSIRPAVSSNHVL